MNTYMSTVYTHKFEIFLKKLKIIFLTLAIGFFMIPTDVSAHGNYLTWKNDAKLINGVGSYGKHVRYFWVDSSASGQTSMINQVRNEWVNTSNI